MKQPKYLIFDARAMTDLDGATVITSANTIEEARQDVKDFGQDACIFSNESENLTEKDFIEYVKV